MLRDSSNSSANSNSNASADTNANNSFADSKPTRVDNW